MPEAEYTTTTALPVRAVWDFVENMDNWCHYLRGYQKHTRESETDSTWVLVGDVGAVARTVQFKVHIDAWRPRELVHFTLDGVNEQLSGEGTFRLSEVSAGESAPDAGAEGAEQNWLARVVRWLYRLLFGRVARARADTPSAERLSGARAQLRFHLRVTPGGPMGPMVDALLKPLMLPVAEELAEKIMAELERRAAATPQPQPANP